jgi:hypothetical protein
VKFFPRVLWCASALLSWPGLALADEASLATWARHQAETRRFSRERPGPHERRVRVTQTTASVDKKGHEFLAFAIDVRYGTEWHENDVLGCVYRGSGELFVKNGDAYRPAAFLLGKNLQPVPGACEAAPPAPPPRA